MAYDYQRLKVRKEGRLATVTVSNPPINIITVELYAELAALSRELKADPDLTVVVLKSADPDFFLAHFDVSAILRFPTDTEAERDSELNEYHLMCERFRTMDKVTIAQIEGRVGGGGSELAASFDMRFGVRGKTFVNQMEVPLGILPGGTGTQRLPRLVGRGRAWRSSSAVTTSTRKPLSAGAISTAASRPTRSARSSTGWRAASRRSRWKLCGWRRRRSSAQTSRCRTAWLTRPICSSACCVPKVRKPT